MFEWVETLHKQYICTAKKTRKSFSQLMKHNQHNIYEESLG